MADDDELEEYLEMGGSEIDVLCNVDGGGGNTLLMSDMMMGGYGGI